MVDDWMPKLVEASKLTGDRSLTLALFTQQFDEAMHKQSIARIGCEVLGIRGGRRHIRRSAKKNNNFVAERFFKDFNKKEASLLNKPVVTEADFYEALFVYGIISEDAVANNDAMIRRERHKDDGFETAYPGMNEGQKNVRRDEGRHVRIAFLASRDFLLNHPEGQERLTKVSLEYLDLAEDMFVRAKNTHGLIDNYVQNAYGPGVDALYYYVTNLQRLAVRLSQLGLGEAVAEIQRRVEWAIEIYTDKAGEPIVENPDYIARKFGKFVLLSGALRRPPETSRTHLARAA